MLKQSKQKYLSPKVEQLEARVERGFAGSGASGSRTSGSTEGLTNSGYSYSGSQFN